MSESTADVRYARLAVIPLQPVGRPSGIAATIKDLWDQRGLVRLLVKRELRARYKNSSLGVLWSLIRPLSQLLIYYFAIGKILGLERQIPSFAIFVFVGLTGWTLLTEIITKDTTSIVSNAGLVKKVYLPREVFPLAGAGSALFSFGVQLVILLVATAAVGQFPLTWNVGTALLGVLLLIVYGFALGLALSALNVYFRDLEHLVEVLLVVLFWASPIVYSFSFVHGALQGNWIEQVYLGNPFTLAILGMQRGLWTAGEATVWPEGLELRMLIALVVGVIILWIAQRIFSRVQGNFAQEL